jgi:hypothetical protein
MIPWVGDIVKINHDHIYTGGQRTQILSGSLLRDEGVRVKGIVCAPDDPNLVGIIWEALNGFTMGQVSIRSPEGRYHSDPIGSPSLFLLVFGAEQCSFKQYDLIPVPVPGDVVELKSNPPREYDISACNCRSQNINTWPHGKMECGAHILGVGGGPYWGLGYIVDSSRPTKGWVYDGVLKRSKSVQQQQTWDATSLKIANTRPDVVKCAKCGGDLKDPGCGPTYRHCPKCEP